MDTLWSLPGTSSATAVQTITKAPWIAPGDYWMPVDQYIAGSNTRCSTCSTLGSSPRCCETWHGGQDEPSATSLPGMVCKETLRCGEHGCWAEDAWKSRPRYTAAHVGELAEVGRKEKMSKSKLNVVDRRNSSIDTSRHGPSLLLFASPPEKDLDGVTRWKDVSVSSSGSGVWCMKNGAARSVEPYHGDGSLDSQARPSPQGSPDH